jgi:N utilization substance protein B
VSRRRAREFALQAMYQLDASEAGAELDKAGPRVLSGLWAGQADEDGIGGARPADEEERDYAHDLVAGVMHHQARLDALIEEASTNWRLTRRPVVDRNILRIAAFELTERMDVPANVSINEAIELAKRYGDKDSRAFVNGILDRIAAEVGRGGRKNRPR